MSEMRIKLMKWSGIAVAIIAVSVAIYAAAFWNARPAYKTFHHDAFMLVSALAMIAAALLGQARRARLRSKPPSIGNNGTS